MFSKNLQTLLDNFAFVSDQPRGSGREEKIRTALAKRATEKGLETVVDKAGNLLIRVPGRGAAARRPTVVLQGHMDMVCEKTPDSRHDFTSDPISIIRDGDWLHADHTTLGADDGVAIAVALAVAEDNNLVHPPLEILLTVDEETGLHGALNLPVDLLTGTRLINIDSDTFGIFTIGCAGGRDTRIELPLLTRPVNRGLATFTLKVGGLTGGHSGGNIHLNRANAIILLARWVNDLMISIPGLKLASLKGGSAHNAIPRDAEAVIVMEDQYLDTLHEHTVHMRARLQAEHADTDPNLTLEALSHPGGCPTLVENTGLVLDLLLSLPHGPLATSTRLENLVETSSNLALATIEGDNLTITTSQRSSVMSRLDYITLKTEAVARMAGAKVESGRGYPAWQPVWNSPLLAKCKEIYFEQTGNEARVEVIHAGLECGIISDKYPQMELISIGADVVDMHAPTERLYIPSLEKLYDFLVKLLASL